MYMESTNWSYDISVNLLNNVKTKPPNPLCHPIHKKLNICTQTQNMYMDTLQFQLVSMETKVLLCLYV